MTAAKFIEALAPAGKATTAMTYISLAYSLAAQTDLAQRRPAGHGLLTVLGWPGETLTGRREPLVDVGVVADHGAMVTRRD